MRRGKLLYHAQHFALVFKVQPVAGFNLQGGDAFAQQTSQPLAGQRQQLRFAAFPGGAHGRVNAAAVCANGLVGNAVEALLPLLRPAAAKNQMRMAIDQPRRKQPAAEVDTSAGWRIAFGHNGLNTAIAHQQHVVLQQAIRPGVSRVEGSKADVSPDYAFGKSLCHCGQLVMGCIDIYFDSTRNVNSDRGKCYLFVIKSGPFPALNM